MSLFTYEAGKVVNYVSSVQMNTSPWQMGIAWHYRAGTLHPCPCPTLREESPVIPKLGAPFWHTLGQIGAGAWALGRALARGVLLSGRHGREGWVAPDLHRTPDTVSVCVSLSLYA